MSDKIKDCKGNVCGEEIIEDEGVKFIECKTCGKREEIEEE